VPGVHAFAVLCGVARCVCTHRLVGGYICVYTQIVNVGGKEESDRVTPRR